MKHLLVSAMLLIGLTTAAQVSENQGVQETIEAFFDAFHKQDAAALKQMVVEGVILQTIATDSLGNNQVQTEDFSAFIKSIESIPEKVKFKETIKSFSIQVDGAMANAWTPYEFHVNEKFSHCGVNSFQLVKQDLSWKIVYLIDTRRRLECN